MASRMRKATEVVFRDDPRYRAAYKALYFAGFMRDRKRIVATVIEAADAALPAPDEGQVERWEPRNRSPMPEDDNPPALASSPPSSPEGEIIEKRPYMKDGPVQRWRVIPLGHNEPWFPEEDDASE